LHNPYASPNAVLSEPIAADGFYDPQLFSVHGRIGRLRYLAYSWVLSLGVGIVAAILIGILSQLSPSIVRGIIKYMSALAYIFLSIPSLLIARRRFHDLDHSGWLCLLMLVPFLNGLIGLYLIFGRGSDGANSYGPPPSKNTTLVVIGGVMLPVIAIIGILAAVAIPAYQTYTQRVLAAKHANGV